ncbi:hypothetical protein [Pseudobacteriovorax antillogorgiicola]|nr:hypothetical protein [Pseudobacteriovorax antillogorgiicola]
MKFLLLLALSYLLPNCQQKRNNSGHANENASRNVDSLSEVNPSRSDRVSSHYEQLSNQDQFISKELNERVGKDIWFGTVTQKIYGVDLRCGGNCFSFFDVKPYSIMDF